MTVWFITGAVLYSASKFAVEGITEAIEAGDGRQPGDPVRAAAAVRQLAAASQPPLRLHLGSDCVRLVEDKLATVADELDHWRDLALSTDFPRIEQRITVSIPYLARTATTQRIAWIGGSVHRIVLDRGATGDRLSAFRSSMRGGAASPVHVHDREDETVFLLAGSGVFWAGDQRWELGSGDTAFLPRGVPHTYLITSGTLDMLTVCTPGGAEELFLAAGWDLRDPQPEDWAVDMAALRAAAEACGQHVLGPPLAATDVMPAEYLAAAPGAGNG